jgi:hypothetical protein
MDPAATPAIIGVSAAAVTGRGDGATASTGRHPGLCRRVPSRQLAVVEGHLMTAPQRRAPSVALSPDPKRSHPTGLDAPEAAESQRLALPVRGPVDMVGNGATATLCSAPLRPEALLTLQRTHGNAFVQRLLAVQRDGRRDQPATKEPPKESGGVAIPWTRFQGWATKAIEKYEVGATDGLNDFEKNVKDPSKTDWQTFALNTVGNLIWAVACFATGGTAFFISLAGIALAAGATAAVMAEEKQSFDMTRFHHHTRRAISGEGGVVEKLNAKVVDASQKMEREAASGRWTDPNQAHRALLERLFTGPEFVREEGGLPTVNKWAVAKKVESELLIATASAMPGRPSVYKGRGPEPGVYLSLRYVAPNAMEDDETTKPFNQWGAKLKKAAIRDDTGTFPNIAERLTEIYGKTFKERMPIGQWPFQMDIGVVVGADAPISYPGPPWVMLVVPPRGIGPRRQRGVGLHEVPGRTFLKTGDSGHLSEETGRLIFLDALPPFNVTALEQING